MAAAQTPMTLQEFANAINPGVAKAFFDTVKDEAPKLDSVAQVDTLRDYNQTEVNFTGLGLLELTGEAEAYKEDAMYEGFSTIYTPQKFTKRSVVTEELMIYDKVGLTDRKRMGSDLGRALNATTENQISTIFRSAFLAAGTSYGDGKPLISTNHTRVDNGSAFSNASSTGLPLTHDNLTVAITSMRNTLNDRGIISSLTPKTLIVPPALESQALEIVKSMGRSDTADRADNVHNMREYSGGMLKVVVWTYLGSAAGGSDTAWFLLADESPIKWYWALKPQLNILDDTDENKNGTLAFVAKYIAAVGWGNPRGIWGSLGNNQAYAL